MTLPLSDVLSASLILVMLFGYILISVGIMVTRRRHRKDVAELSSEIEQLRADVESLKKG
jgi:cell division protein FtsL